VSHSAYRPETRDGIEEEVMTDHRENIFDAFRSRTEDVRQVLGYMAEGEDAEEDAYSDLDSLILESTVWTTPARAPRVELLLAYGGPTERVSVDLGAGRVEYFHSWGMDSCGTDRTDVAVWGDDEAGPWLELAEMLTGLD